ncbi:hypothetical protein P3342_000418 [Pyrenophora teres f. teres]|nr:hypothetical protein P3342_000418 [Pyrenophora teres f. teres]
MSTSPSGSLFIITCNEPKPELDLSHHFNLSTNTTSVIKTPGGRTEGTVASIYQVDQANRIAVIIVVQHTGCPHTPGPSTVQENICADIRKLRTDRYVRKEIVILGYVLDTQTRALSEVNVSATPPDDDARKRVLNEMKDFVPFFC